MANSSSSMKEINSDIAHSEERQRFLESAITFRTKVVDKQFNFVLCHQDIADAIKWFVEQQRSANSESANQVVEDNANEASPTFEINIGQNTPIATVKESKFLMALKDVEKEFRDAYTSCKQVNTAPYRPAASQVSKLIRSLTRSRSARVGDSSYDNSETMGSTLKQLLCWEEKLYDELKKQKTEIKKQSHHKKDSENKDLCNHSAEFIVAQKLATYDSKQISELRDEKLLPELRLQLQELMRGWKTMSECHAKQNNIMSHVEKCSNVPLLCDEVQQKATETLKKQVDKWRCCFESYVSLQKDYMEALCGWLLGKQDSRDPLKSLKSEAKAVTKEMNKFKKVIKSLLNQLKKEHEQKLEVRHRENVVKNREESMKEYEEELQFSCPEREEKLEKEKKKLEKSEEKLKKREKETQNKVSQFRLGFAEVFRKMDLFSSQAAKTYAQLIVKYLPPEKNQQTQIELRSRSVRN